MKAPRDGSAAPAGAPALDPAVEELSRVARRLADAAGAQPPAPARWGRLQAERTRRARRTRARVIGVALALPVLALGVWGARRWSARVPDVSYRLEGAAAVGEGGYIHDVPAAGARLRFSEGTAIALAPGARAWVVSRGPNGARVRLESGRAGFDVVHREGACWSVDAGPFSVQVTGTAFDVVWTGAEEALEVDLRRGSVEVRGPLLPTAGIVLRPGQRLLADLSEKKVQLDGEPTAVQGGAPGTPTPTPIPAGDQPPPVPAAPARRRPAREPADRERRAPAPAVSPAPGRADWAARVAAGQFRGVLDEAGADGLDRCAASCSADALAALADAARYAGRGDLAQRLLLAERARFPGSASARAAAFLLGRLTDEGGAGLTASARNPTAAAAAIQWYDRYLRESPDGAYGSEALARKMLAVERLNDRAGARRLAEEYLRRYPGGAYAPQARALVRQP